MNHWIIAGIIVGLLVIGGIAIISAVSTNNQTTNEITSCSSCGGKCTAGNNCGLATCGATQGKTCNCGRN